MKNSLLLDCRSLRLPDVTAPGATPDTSPEMSSAAVMLKVSSAESELIIVDEFWLTSMTVRETGAQVRFWAAAAAVKLGALANSAATKSTMRICYLSSTNCMYSMHNGVRHCKAQHNDRVQRSKAQHNKEGSITQHSTA